MANMLLKFSTFVAKVYLSGSANQAASSVLYDRNPGGGSRPNLCKFRCRRRPGFQPAKGNTAFRRQIVVLQYLFEGGGVSGLHRYQEPAAGLWICENLLLPGRDGADLML